MKREALKIVMIKFFNTNLIYYLVVTMMGLLFTVELGQWTKYAGFKRAAIASEAKGALLELFNAEKEYFSTHKKYTACISDKEFGLELQGNHRRYFVGFKSALGATENCKSETINTANVTADSNFEYQPYFENTNISNETFTVYAVGRMCAECEIDIWSINEKKVITHIQDGNTATRSFAGVFLILIVIVSLFVGRMTIKHRVFGWSRKE